MKNRSLVTEKPGKLNFVIPAFYGEWMMVNTHSNPRVQCQYAGNPHATLRPRVVAPGGEGSGNPRGYWFSNPD